MQDAIVRDYIEVAAQVQASVGVEPFIVPAGLAWQRVHNETISGQAGLPAGTALVVVYTEELHYVPESDLMCGRVSGCDPEVRV
jgi:hypothetical protein